MKKIIKNNLRKVRKSPVIILLLINIYKIVINEKNEILLIIEIKAENYYNYSLVLLMRRTIIILIMISCQNTHYVVFIIWNGMYINNY